MQAHPLSTSAARNINHSGNFSSIAEGPGLAHDAGNLLGALGLYCDLLNLPGVLRPEHLHYARELRLLSQRSGALIHRLLETDKSPNDPLDDPPLAWRCPSTVVRAFAPLLRSIAAPSAAVTMAVAPELPPLPFAAEVLERILVNLTRNAATALRTHRPLDPYGRPCRGWIRISVGGEATRLRLTVSDNGPGMPPAMAQAFLGPAPLLDGALRGLGHRIVHELLQSTGGKLSINVSPGAGTALQIEWPIPAAVSVASPHCTATRTFHTGSTIAC